MAVGPTLGPTPRFNLSLLRSGIVSLRRLDADHVHRKLPAEVVVSPAVPKEDCEAGHSVRLTVVLITLLQYLLVAFNARLVGCHR